MKFVLHFGLLLILPTVAMNNGDNLFMLMLPIACVGAFLNWYVMSINGGMMPVKMYQDIVFYILPSRGHKPMSETTRLWWLCDHIRLGWGTWLKVVSIGDILVYSGCVMAWVYLAILISRGIG